MGMVANWLELFEQFSIPLAPGGWIYNVYNQPGGLVAEIKWKLQLRFFMYMAPW